MFENERRQYKLFGAWHEQIVFLTDAEHFAALSRMIVPILIFRSFCLSSNVLSWNCTFLFTMFYLLLVAFNCIPTLSWLLGEIPIGAGESLLNSIDDGHYCAIRYILFMYICILYLGHQNLFSLTRVLSLYVDIFYYQHIYAFAFESIQYCYKNHRNLRVLLWKRQNRENKRQYHASRFAIELIFVVSTFYYVIVNIRSIAQF